MMRYLNIQVLIESSPVVDCNRREKAKMHVKKITLHTMMIDVMCTIVVRYQVLSEILNQFNLHSYDYRVDCVSRREISSKL